MTPNPSDAVSNLYQSVGVVRPEEDREVPIPCPPGLTLEQIVACEKFGQAVFGDAFFDHRPAHHGQHGHNCSLCSEVLVAQERSKRSRIRQPWEVAA